MKKSKIHWYNEEERLATADPQERACIYVRQRDSARETAEHHLERLHEVIGDRNQASWELAEVRRRERDLNNKLNDRDIKIIGLEDQIHEWALEVGKMGDLFAAQLKIHTGLEATIGALQAEQATIGALQAELELEKTKIRALEAELEKTRALAERRFQQWDQTLDLCRKAQERGFELERKLDALRGPSCPSSACPTWAPRADELIGPIADRPCGQLQLRDLNAEEEEWPLTTTAIRVAGPVRVRPELRPAVQVDHGRGSDSIEWGLALVYSFGMQGWIITHEHSGCALVGRAYPDVESAQNAARLLCKIAPTSDWLRTGAQLVADQEVRFACCYVEQNTGGEPLPREQGPKLKGPSL